jgi:uncharacterized membrane protein YkvA (DUF1232 family)
MPLSLTFELSDRDLEQFSQAIASTRDAAARKGADEIIASAARLLTGDSKVSAPDFVTSRLERLDAMIAMLRDEGWNLPQEDRERVLHALAYFAEPTDVIPDSVPVLGFLDDAIAIEVCVRELQHELAAYDEFCEYRQSEAERLGQDPEKVGRADWLQSRRDELVDRMHRRRNREAGGTGYGDSSGYARRGYTSSYRPGLMRVR